MHSGLGKSTLSRNSRWKQEPSDQTVSHSHQFPLAGPLCNCIIGSWNASSATWGCMLHRRQYYWRRCVYKMDLMIKLSIAGVTTSRRNANCWWTWREAIISVCMMRCKVLSHVFKHCVNGLHRRILGGSSYIQQDVKHLTYADNCNEDVTFLFFLIIIPFFLVDLW
jgi:hypothetical protein